MRELLAPEATPNKAAAAGRAPRAAEPQIVLREYCTTTLNDTVSAFRRNDFVLNVNG